MNEAIRRMQKLLSEDEGDEQAEQRESSRVDNTADESSLKGFGPKLVEGTTMRRLYGSHTLLNNGE